MKNLVSDIKASARDRAHFVKASKTATHQFLVESEKDRTADFHKIIKDVQAKVRDIQAKVRDISHGSRQLVARLSKESGERTGDVKGLLAEYDKDLKAMAKELEYFLAKSEDARLADFDATMKDVKGRVKDVKGRVKDVVGDTHKLLGHIIRDIRAIQKDTKAIQKDTKDLLGDYKEERKETAHAWEPLRKKRAEAAAEAEGAEEAKEVITPRKRKPAKKKVAKKKPAKRKKVAKKPARRSSKGPGGKPAKRRKVAKKRKPAKKK